MRYLTILFLMFAGNCFAQDVEHNYEMPPQITTCDSLDFSGLSTEDQVAKIENTKFRSVQNFKLNRRDGFQAAWFYSCDNENGILVAKIDGMKKVYNKISKATWEKLITSGDFENFIKENISSIPREN